MTPFTEAAFPYDPKLPLSEIRFVQGPDRLRWIADRQIAQSLLDLWVNIQKRDAKRHRPVANPPHWNEEATNET